MSGPQVKEKLINLLIEENLDNNPEKRERYGQLIDKILDVVHENEKRILKFHFPEELKRISPAILCPDCGYYAKFIMIELYKGKQRLWIHCGSCDIGG